MIAMAVCAQHKFKMVDLNDVFQILNDCLSVCAGIRIGRIKVFHNRFGRI